MVIVKQIKGIKCYRHYPILVEYDGETICRDCAIVLQDKIVNQSEESTYDLAGYFENARTGGPAKLAIHDRGLTTVMNRSNIDYTGKKIQGKRGIDISRLRIWDYRSKQKQKDRSLTKAFTILGTISSQLGIPDGVSEDAAYVCRKAMVKNVAKGRSVREVIGACIYLACRRTDYPKTLDEIADAVGITRKRLSRTFRKIVFDLDIKMQVPNPENYLPKICNTLRISERATRYALDILTKIKEESGYVGAKPNLVCAAAVYYAAMKYEESITQHDLAEVANTSTISLRKYIHDERFKKAVESLKSQ